jgi:hypothetical protein
VNVGFSGGVTVSVNGTNQDANGTSGSGGTTGTGNGGILGALSNFWSGLWGGKNGKGNFPVLDNIQNNGYNQTKALIKQGKANTGAVQQIPNNAQNPGDFLPISGGNPNNKSGRGNNGDVHINISNSFISQDMVDSMASVIKKILK